MGTEKRGQGQGWGRHHLLCEQRHHWGNGCDWGLTLGQACVATLSPTADPGRAMKVLLLTGLGALFFAYYWDDNFDPGKCLGVGEGGVVCLSCPCPKLTTPAHHQPASTEPVYY